MQRRSIFPKAAPLHDHICGMLSAIYMARGEFSLFFENINCVKNVADTVERQLELLLTAYLTGKSYHDTAVTFSSQKAAEIPAEEIIAQMLQSCAWEEVQSRAASAEENITRPQVSALLHTLMNFLDTKAAEESEEKL